MSLLLGRLPQPYLSAVTAEARTVAEEAKGLREALAEARRPFWKRWLGA